MEQEFGIIDRVEEWCWVEDILGGIVYIKIVMGSLLMDLIQIFSFKRIVK